MQSNPPVSVPLRLGIVIPVWKRPNVAIPVLRYYRRLSRATPHVDIRVVVAVSPDDPYESVFLAEKESTRFRFCRVTNKPVSDKWNKAFEMLRSVGVDAACSVNSDMYVTPAYFKAAATHIRRGVRYVEPTGCYFVNAVTGKAFFARWRNMGVSAVMSRYVLEKVNFAPYPTGINSGIDANLRRRLGNKAGEMSTVRIQEHFMRGDMAHVDVKSYSEEEGALVSDNINSFEVMRKATGRDAKSVAAKEIFSYFFDGVMPAFL
jgi:hypothetical protein